MTIYFYSQLDEPYGCLSNFSPHGFELDGLWWPTLEHYFQAQKFVGTEHLEEIRLAKTPADAAKMGRERSRPLRKDWEEIKDDVMERGLLCKFQTHQDIGQILLDTGDELIIEDAPYDYYWGCGKDGSGKNRLGEILMKVRTRLRNN
ncbi:NADAR family protein [Okeania sp. SIO1I7]|uniref:NADAR family protein n=1 Tax=Okeania sp. SIO1I7 TaxID=2607772 RepID=UPI0013F7E5F3|nr:NADAR family protein [Okeania sp. SIO1I7]NET28102.1 NADAR family protein [Okeania sp. SIO1I7]